MGTRYVCDGCQGPIPAGVVPQRVGTIKAREYCIGCAGKAEAYMRAVNRAHAELAAQWQARLQQIRQEHCDGMGCLPDTAQEVMSKSSEDQTVSITAYGPDP